MDFGLILRKTIPNNILFNAELHKNEGNPCRQSTIQPRQTPQTNEKYPAEDLQRSRPHKVEAKQHTRPFIRPSSPGRKGKAPPTRSGRPPFDLNEAE
jgi:hypothetical protein